MCASASKLVSLALFLVWLLCPVLICLFLFYFIVIIPQMSVCFITRDRKGEELEGEEMGRNWEEQEEGKS